MFGLSIPELTVVAIMCLTIVLLAGAVLKKMGYSDLTAIGLALLLLTPLNWLVLAVLVFIKWPVHEELELLRRQIDEASASVDSRPAAQTGQSNPLHVAIEKGYSDVVEALISQGVDLSVKTPDGQTPLQLAEASGQDKVVELLRRHGTER